MKGSYNIYYRLDIGQKMDKEAAQKPIKKGTKPIQKIPKSRTNSMIYEESDVKGTDRRVM